MAACSTCPFDPRPPKDDHEQSGTRYASSRNVDTPPSSGQTVMRSANLERRLLAERARLSKQVTRIEADFAAPMDDDLAEQAIERADDEALEGEERVAVARLRAIDAALARLHAGTYGICVECGATISEKRLAAIPEAPRCARCAGAAAQPGTP